MTLIPLTLRRLLALILMLDGFNTALFGRRFLHLQEEIAPDWYNEELLPHFYRWPERQLRVAGLLEGLVGLWLF
ncbi:MAG: hypothetical protein R3272_16285 [Candidatus Promineifilaceae bacterium]|nr:hypothetical protein [Candidatus Promineifilaceae bacterium]